MKRRYVADESSQECLGWAREYVVNARFLYHLEGNSKTFGFSDDYLYELSKKHNLTIITRDKNFILKTLANGDPIVWHNEEQKRKPEYVLLKPTSEILNPEKDFGERKLFERRETHLELMGMVF